MHTLEQAIALMDRGRVKAHRGMRLGEIIDALDDTDDSAVVAFDFEYMAPSGFTSYRGYYSDMAITFDGESFENCGAFRAALAECVGKTFEGYKGGDNTMTRDTPVWVANYGHAGGTAVVRVTDNDYEVILHTAKID